MTADRVEGGPLIIIGGHEDKDGEKVILKEVAEHVGRRRLVVATVASRDPEGYFDTYAKVFNDLGLHDLVELYLHDRAETCEDRVAQLFADAGGVFFTGGDQLRISSQIGDTPVERMVRDLHRSGGVVAGTSAGASFMSHTMLVRGASQESHRIGDLHIATGLGLVRDVIIDQHFAERGRIGRLLGAVAQNPRLLGLGIDEDTAMIVTGTRFRVAGSGAVYVVDGSAVTHSNIAEASSERTLSMHGVHLHVLSSGDGFDLSTRRPAAAPRQTK
ncbi:MAG: cyanophycinase [Pseudomonadota bacterium]